MSFKYCDVLQRHFGTAVFCSVKVGRNTRSAQTSARLTSRQSEARTKLCTATRQAILVASPPVGAKLGNSQNNDVNENPPRIVVGEGRGADAGTESATSSSSKETHFVRNDRVGSGIEPHQSSTSSANLAVSPLATAELHSSAEKQFTAVVKYASLVSEGSQPELKGGHEPCWPFPNTAISFGGVY